MSEEATFDDQSQSHYEISLTAGQAFVAFVLLLLSLAASFAFGLMIGKGQADERLVVRKEPAVVNEAAVLPKKSEGKIVELGVAADDFKQPAATETAAPVATITEGEQQAAAGGEQRAASGEQTASAAPVATPLAAPRSPLAQPAAQATPVPAYAQLLSTGDQKTAESLAAKLIDRGYTAAYVERGSNEKGPIFRVRIKFASDVEAHAAEAKLREFSKEVWITKETHF